MTFTGPGTWNGEGHLPALYSPVQWAPLVLSSTADEGGTA